MNRQRVTLCREGFYYVAMMLFIVGGALIREVNLLMFIAAIMVGPLVISWRMIYVVLDKLTIIRHLPDCCTAGDTLTVQLVASNARRRLPNWAITLTDRITMPEQLGSDHSSTLQQVRVLLHEVPPQSETTVSYSLRPMNRGRYRLGPLTVETRFPLGLLRRRVTRQQKHDLIVYPSRGRLVSNWRQTLRSPGEGTQQASHRVGLLEGDFHAFRDWQPGDSRRWIHWRTSARRGQLTVRQFEQQTDQDVVLLLDLTANDESKLESNEAASQTAAREQAIRFAATVVTIACRNTSHRITVGIAGKTVRQVTGTGNVTILHEILEQLALAQPGHPDQLSDLLRSVAPGLSARQGVWLVTPQPVEPARQQVIKSVLGQATTTGDHSLKVISVGSPLWNEIFDDTSSSFTHDAT